MVHIIDAFPKITHIQHFTHIRTCNSPKIYSLAQKILRRLCQFFPTPTKRNVVCVTGTAPVFHPRRHLCQWTRISFCTCYRIVLLTLQERVLTDTVVTEDGVLVEGVCRGPHLGGAPGARGVAGDGGRLLLPTQPQDVQHQETCIQLFVGRKSQVRHRVRSNAN